MTLASILAFLMSANATIPPGSAGVAIRQDTLAGLPLCIWNDSGLFSLLKSGMREAREGVFRYPNGSISNEYHWNGSGQFDDDSLWVPSNTTFSPGWVGETVHRGTSKNSYGFVRQSLIDDGDTTTFWWSNPDHPDAPGWFEMDLGVAKTIDSFAVWLGDLRPDSIQIVQWPRVDAVYPLPHQQRVAWTEIARLPASSFLGYKLSSAISARYVGMRPIGTLDSGWQVREFQALKSGRIVSNNIPDGASQTKVYAVSTIPAVRKRTYSSNWDFESYMTWIHAYPGAQPMICVNYGGGTPQEAAAWVHYANKVKGYGIKRWQIGNEMAGDWEDGGPVSARQYAVRFVAYSRAMKAEDPGIWVEGPVIGSDQFTQNASGDFDGQSWMQGFLVYVDSVERTGKIRLLDGIDFHTYPYWFSASPVQQTMIDSCDGSGAAYDTLKALIDRTLSDKSFREVLMTEYNTSTISSSLEQTTSAGTATGLQLAHFIQRFGDRGVAVLWELFEGGGVGPDGTWGTLSEFVKPTQGEWSSLGYAPNTSFWATRAITRQWLDTAGGDTIMPVDLVSGARLFAVRNAGRVSILAFNLSADSTSLSLDPTLFPNGGDILSWGTGEYLWNGTGSDARAIPNNGPSSKTFANLSDLKIPPYGMLVVRGAGRAKQAPRTAHWLVNSTVLTINDTLVLSGWTTGEQVKLTGGTWAVGGASGTLTATDGTWDGPSESWVAKIPASDIGVGSWTVNVSVTDNLNETAKDSTSLEVTGSIRPVNLIADFEQKKIATVAGQAFYSYTADTGKVSAKLVARDNGFCLRDTIVLTQPANLSYTNYGTGFSGITNAHRLDSTLGLVGVMFDIATKHSAKEGTFAMSVNLTSVKDYNNYAIAVPNTKGAWIRDTVLFSSLAQGAGNWGGGVVPFDVDSITGLNFYANGAGTISMSIDNIYFLGTKGAAIDVGVRRSPKSPLLALSGRRLSVATIGPWVLRLVSADGRVSRRWTGNGSSAFVLPHSTTPLWAILERDGTRHTLSIPPAMQ